MIEALRLLYVVAIIVPVTIVATTFILIAGCFVKLIDLLGGPLKC